MKSDTIAKIIVLLITIVLWLHVNLTKEQTTEMAVPLLLHDLPSDLVYDSAQPLTMPVLLTGSGFDLVITRLNDHYFKVPASGMQYGDNAIVLSAEALVVPEIVSLQVDFSPDGNERKLFLDRIVTETRGVELEYASTKEEEYFIRNRIGNSNQNITITGPERVVSQIKRIKTVPISRKMMSDGSIAVTLMRPDPRVTMDKTALNLTIITSKQVNRTFSLIPVEYPHDLNISIIPQKVSAMVRGPEEVVDKMTVNSLKARLNISQMWISNSGTVDFDLPAGVKLIEYTPKKIQIQTND